MSSEVDQAVRLRPLSILADGEDILVGDPDTGTFITVPMIGGVVLRALQRGATVAQAAQEAEQQAGEPVDVMSFVGTLAELGFLEEPRAPAEPRLPEPTAPIQMRRWWEWLRPGLARPLFGRVAWTCYGAIALTNLILLVGAYDHLWPRPSADAFVLNDIGLSALLLMPLMLLLAGLHEGWHWLAARAQGVPARFGVDRRMVFIVFETDLSRLWTLPRRQRYSALLAGLALDSTLLCLVLLGRLAISTGGWSPPQLVSGVLGGVQFLLMAGITLQCMVFLRTDMYAVLLNATGCRNLWRVKSLLLRRAFRRLTAAQAAELATADPVDLRVGRWFRWVWLTGAVAIMGWFIAFVVPVAWTIVGWVGEGLAAGPGSGQFWYHLLCAAVLFAPLTAVAILAARSALSWRAEQRRAQLAAAGADAAT